MDNNDTNIVTMSLTPEPVQHVHEFTLRPDGLVQCGCGHVTSQTHEHAFKKTGDDPLKIYCECGETQDIINSNPQETVSPESAPTEPTQDQQSTDGLVKEELSTIDTQDVCSLCNQASGHDPMCPVVYKTPPVKEIIEEKPKHAGGRPCKFCQNADEYMRKTNEYIERCKKSKDGKMEMPYIEQLALELDTIDTNIVNWANKKMENEELEHPEFFAAYSLVKMLQKLRLQQRALGRYQPMGALSLLKFNHGMMETSKQVLAGDKDEPITIEIIDEKPTLKD